MTIGEDRVRVNNVDSARVSQIKQKTAELIDLCEQAKDFGHAEAETARLWALAQTAYEEAAMWAVKAATATPAS